MKFPKLYILHKSNTFSYDENVKTLDKVSHMLKVSITILLILITVFVSIKLF